MKNYNKFIVINSVFTVIQIITVSLLYYILYKQLIAILGLEIFGLWSLIFAISSVSTIGNLGFGGAIVKYAAEFQAKKKWKQLNALVNSAILLVILGLLIIEFLIYFISPYIIGFFVKEQYIELSLSIMPIILLSIFINVIASMFFSLIEGLNISFYKSIATIAALFVFFFTALMWVEEKGLYGLAYANLSQSCMFLFLSLVFLKIAYPTYSFFYFKWHKRLMKEVIGYSINFQTIGIINMLTEPITKSILSKYAGLDFVGIFELANKLVLQIRSLSSGILMNLVPKIAQKNINFKTSEIIEIYKKVNNINSILLWTLLMSLIPFAPLLSIFLLEEINEKFVICLYIMTFGWMLISLNISGYIINIATAKLKWNIISHLVFAIFNTLLLFIIGHYTRNGIYMITASSVALFLSGLVLIVEFHYRYKLRIRDLINPYYAKIGLLYALFFAVSWYINLKIENIYFQALALIITAFSYAIALMSSVGAFRENLKEIITQLRKKVK